MVGKFVSVKEKKNKRNSFKPEPDRLMWIVTMVRQWKTFFFILFLMFQANYDGNKQMVPIRKLFSKNMQGSTHYNKIIIKYNNII